MQQQELADMVSVSRPTVSDWENHKKDPSGERLRRLAEIFKVDPLIVLGKGVYDMTQIDPNAETVAPQTPKTVEARTLAMGVDKMTPEERDKLMRMVRLMFEATDYFNQDA